MFQAFLDESGTDGHWPVVCVGGYVAPRENWEAFEKAWAPKLIEAGIECFHAKEKSSHQLWGPMLELIHQSGLRGLLTTASAKDFKRLMVPKARSITGNAYASCTFACALKIAGIAKKHGHGPVAFVIEAGQPNVEWVRETLEMLIGKEEFNIAAVAVAGKKDFVPLQAADFLAHCAGTHQREWLEVLVGNGPGKVGHSHMTKQMLQDTSTKLIELGRKYRQMKRQAKLARRASGATSPPLPEAT